MFNYVNKGKWLECEKCGRSHRKILESEISDFIDKDTKKNIKLTDKELEHCYYCEPITLYYVYVCKNCRTNSIISTTFNSVKTTICPCCGFDTNIHKSNSPALIESLPKLDSGAKELFNRIKKRNIGSNMPDY